MTATAATDTAPAAGWVRARLFGAAVVVAVADLTLKAAAAAALTGRGTLDLPGPLDLRLLFNPGAAFGLGAALPVAAVLAVTGALVAAVVLVAWRAAPTLGTIGRAGLALLLGGAVANLIDRGLDGVVTDYLHTGWWPTFNLADVTIVTGAGLLLLGSLRRPPTPEPPARPAAEPVAEEPT